MQNRYVGDVGDFGKCGLLRGLVGEQGARALSLGVVWYLVRDHGPPGDGRYTTYFLKRERFRGCDPWLFDKLLAIVGTRRHVSEIRKARILPEALFHEALLEYDLFPLPERLTRRRDWLEAAVASVEPADIVFVDPDNGLESRTPRHRKSGRKYVYIDELDPYLRRNQTVVVYQHLPRQPHQAYIKTRCSELVAKLEFKGTVWALRWRPYAPRAYFILGAPRHVPMLTQRIDRLLSSPWREHFDLVVPSL